MPKIVRFHEFGDASVLKLDEMPMPEPKSDEVRIKVKAIGLNRAEVVFREGMYLERPKNLPSLIGYEASGLVDAIGQGVSGFKANDKVSTIPAFSMNQYGVYGEYAIVPARALSHYPEHLSFEEATSIWMQYMTAYGALIDIAKIKEGDYVLISAASSSVGLAAIEICLHHKAIPIATTRTSAKKSQLLEAGAHAVIVTDDQDLAEEVNKITNGKGVNYVFDPVAGKFLKECAKATAHGGTIFEYGVLSKQPCIFPLFEALQKGLTVRGYTLFEITSDPNRMERGKKYVFDRLQDKTFKPKIDKTFSLANIQEAHKHMESNTQTGKIVVTV
jgi:NADPH:quinone reductase-like Zn-dependent oxidoreductase